MEIKQRHQPFGSLPDIPKALQKTAKPFQFSDSWFQACPLVRLYGPALFPILVWAKDEGIRVADDPHYWAKRAFDRQDERAEKQFDAAVDSATNALKAALLLNGGACIALLAFLSSTYGIEHFDTDRARLIGTIANSLKWFALGAAASVLANACGYLANRFFAESASSYRKTFDYPYIRPTNTSKAWNVSAVIFNVVGAIIGLSSIVLFLYGLIKISAVF